MKLHSREKEESKKHYEEKIARDIRIELNTLKYAHDREEYRKLINGVTPKGNREMSRRRCIHYRCHN